MSINLSQELSDALEGNDHHPIVKIISSQMKAEIPLVGTKFQSENPVSSVRPVVFQHSSGRMVSLSVDDGYLKMAYTDVARTSWTFAASLAGGGITGIAAIELANGNIGIAYLITTSIYTQVFTGIGTPVENSLLTAVTDTVSFPALCRTSAGTLLAYQRQSGSDYYISKRTSNAAMTSAWSASADITLSGIVVTEQKANLFLQRHSDGHITLFFDYKHDYVDTHFLQDIYSIHSENDGATWTSPAKLTAYDTYSSQATTPSATIASNGDLIVAFNEQSSVITLSNSLTGWCVSSNSVLMTQFDAASGLLFVAVSLTYGGVAAVVVIDTTTFEVVKCYNATDTSPKYNRIFWEQDSSPLIYPGEGQYVVFGGAFTKGICIIDHQTETIKEYFFEDNVTYDILKNIEIPTENGYFAMQDVYGFSLDAASGKLYVGLYNGYIWHPTIKYGYIDITESADPVTGMYEWHDIVTYAVNRQMVDCWFRTYPNEDYAMFVWTGGSTTIEGKIMLFQLDSGILIKEYDTDLNPGIPWRPGLGAVIKDNKIYLSIQYSGYNDQEDRRGMCIIDILNDTVIYERPTYATYDDYGLTNPILIENDTKILWGSLDGVVEYTINTHTWRLFDSSTVVGLPEANRSLLKNHVSYDNTNNIVFTGSLSAGPVYAFNPDGVFNTPHYFNATTASTPTELVSGSPNLNPAITYDPDGGLWALWLNVDIESGNNYLSWAKTGLAQDVAGYLVKDSPLSIQWEVDRPATAKFTLANGHLFDPTNTLSIYSVLFKKHRIVTISLGESVDGDDYYQDQGVFIVTGISLSLTKTEHPTIDITAEDRSSMWDEVIVTATENYGGADLDAIMTDLLEDVGNLTSAEYSIPAFSNLHLLYIQWVDESLRDIIDQLCNHFGMFPHWGTDGVFTFKPFDLDAATSHIYSDAKIVQWSPQDDNASYINRVTVKAESHVTHEVLYPEERVTDMNGTCGWWGGKKDKIIYYSNDRTRTMRYPRLVINRSVSESAPFAGLIAGGGGESITDIDASELWCEVTIEQPDMLMWVFGLAAVVAAFGVAAYNCWLWCGIWILATNMALAALITVLSGVANYEYEIWARPIGHVKQMIQATANDEDFQRDMNGQIIEHTIEDTLAYEIEHCQMVADHEIAIVSAQRNRVQLKKICHLMDELGDIVEINHPYSNQLQRIFIARLTREFIFGEKGDFSDKIEGWIV